MPLLSPTPDLTYAATARCPCGAGLAYDRTCVEPPFRGPSYWDCSAILLGTAIPADQPGAVQHTDRLPFAFYEIKSEAQPSARGATTRPTAPAERRRRGVLLWLCDLLGRPAD